MTDLLDELIGSMPTTPEDAMSTRELAAASGKSRSYVDERLKELFDSGRLGVGRKEITKRDGSKGNIPAYWLVSELEEE